MSAVFDKKRLVSYKKAREDKENYQIFKSEKEEHVYYIRFRAADPIYEGQKHILKMKLVYGSNLKYEFPTHAPYLEFVTPIWHPNVGVNGAICLDTLKDNWVPTYGITQVIDSIKLLLACPNPSSPMNSSANKATKKSARDYYDEHLTQNMIDLLQSPEFEY